MHVSNNEEMVFNCTEVIVYCYLFKRDPYKDSAGKRYCAREFEAIGTKIKVNTFTHFVLGRLKEKEDMEKLGF